MHGEEHRGRTNSERGTVGATDKAPLTANGLGSVDPDGASGAQPLAESIPRASAVAVVEVVPGSHWHC